MQIVAFHTGATFLSHARVPSRLVLVAFRGYVAVLLFYILSGFILSYNYLGQDLSKPRNRWKFWVARFARIYPAYLLAFLLSIPFAPSTPLPVTLRNAFLMLTMTQAWSPYTAHVFNFTAWSLSVEMFFYLAFPFLLMRLRNVSDRALWVVMSAALTIGIVIPMVLGAMTLPLTAEQKWIFITSTPLFRLPEFIIGVSLGLLYIRHKRDDLSNRGGMLATGAVLASLMLMATVWPATAEHYSMNSLLIVPFAALVFALAQGGGWIGRFLTWRPIVILGEASYGIYILQFPVRSWMRAAVPPYDAVLSPLVLVLVAVASFFLFEEPARRAIRRWLSGRADSVPHQMATLSEP